MQLFPQVSCQDAVTAAHPLTPWSPLFQCFHYIFCLGFPDWQELPLVYNLYVWAQLMGAKAKVDPQPLVAEDTLVLAENRIGEPGVKCCKRLQ